ncbi:hypothetical protein F5B22DRAFT_626700 [Xylaria bambusicola]|uniref:uncharacterized protein n=1 Tax=Xylaria bambusicola TaxID=326684 RepID=UPI0020077592|nr:uncharacterized protein F5B22DRAFT_626700 [Xylaria bambusicola]KAI0505759.1 hypothetical protein F5B22DRAFT_626700 [Xylaria bambusicola]
MTVNSWLSVTNQHIVMKTSPAVAQNTFTSPSLTMIWIVFLTLCSIVLGVLWVFHLYRPRSPMKQDINIRPIKRISQKGGVNLVQVNPEMTEENTDIDIIAIHGLDTTSATTWTWKDGTNWLKEVEMLPSQVGPARIFTCDWPADRFEPSDIVQATLQVHGRRLLDGIQQHLSHADDTRKTSRPLFFIASCLGGIILAQALVDANDIGSNYRHIREATRGIIFLATPFRGTSFGKIAPWAMPCLEALANFQSKRVNNLFNNVKKSSLEELLWKFTGICQDRDFPYIISTCYETKKTMLPSGRWYSRWLPRLLSVNEVLVTKSSASLDFVPEPLELRRKHRDMNKFENHNCKDYRAVVHRIRCILAAIRAGTPLQQVDKWLNSRHYNDEKLQIERLSGDLLPMKDCYINLAIVERPSHAESAFPDRGNNRDTLFQISQFTRQSRLEVETPEKGNQADLATLFSPHEFTDGTNIMPKRILIHGRAGIGKTTLCKKIVSEFRDGQWPEWNQLFDRVLWIPLRNLKLSERRVRGYGLKDLFYDEFFSKGAREDLAEALIDSLAAGKTLFLLDGLDEVAQDLSSNDAMSTMLREQLLKMPNVIITSRPYPRLPDNIHLELETIGFYPNQITQYMQASLGEQEANQMQLFFRSHPLMHSLMRIPIQLDAFCFLWAKDNSNLKTVKTMTDVYQAIELGLWKRDILRLGKRHEGELVAPGHLESSGWQELEPYIEEEELFLERLASAGLYHGIIEFNKRHLNDALKHSGLLFDRTVPHLSFLRTSDPSQSANNRKYHFIHLTYQEYFAAKYFVRQYVNGNNWMYCGGQTYEGDENTNGLRAVGLFREHKYSAHYDMVWRFTAGLLDSPRVSDFFEEMDKSPLDLVGPVHQRLVMNCLSEANTSKCQDIRQDLEAKLSEWLLLECDLIRVLRLLSRPAPASGLFNPLHYSPLITESFPERSLSEALKKGTIIQRMDILKALQFHGTYLSGVKIKDVKGLLRYNRYGERYFIFCTLKNQSNLPQDILDYILSYWDVTQEEESKRMRREPQYRKISSLIADTIGMQLTLRPKITKELMELVQGGDMFRRKLASRALSHRSDLRGNVTILLTFLEKISSGQCSDRQLYDAIFFALNGTSSFPKESIIILHRLLGSADYDVSDDAVTILARGSHFSDEFAAYIIRTLQVNHDQKSRWCALDALHKHTNLPVRIVEILVQMLENAPDPCTRQKAATTIAIQSSILPQIRTSLKSLTANSDALIRLYASIALNEQVEWICQGTL